MVAFQRERVLDQRPHGADPVGRRDREPEVEVDLVHLREGARHAARPLGPAASGSGGGVIHLDRIASGEVSTDTAKLSRTGRARGKSTCFLGTAVA
jgi:hypothetical protein